MLILLISIVRDRSNVIGKQLMNNEQSVGGDWMDGVDGISLDCYDFQSTCGADVRIKYTKFLSIKNMLKSWRIWSLSL